MTPKRASDFLFFSIFRIVFFCSLKQIFRGSVASFFAIARCPCRRLRNGKGKMEWPNGSTYEVVKGMSCHRLPARPRPRNFRCFV